MRQTPPMREPREREELSPVGVAAGPVLRVRGVHKAFGGLSVLRGVDLTLQAAEILALVGENGAGKSTLVQCIARPALADAGTVEIQSAADAASAAGALAVVWQDLALCDNLSVVANLFLGSERVTTGLLDEASMVEEARSLFERLGLTRIHPLQPVRTLSGGQRQLVAIARAVRRDPSVIVLDEPTASLGVSETRAVEQLLGQLRASGTAILLVSHRLEQVFNLADRIAVLRDGRVVAEVSPLEVHPDDVAALISGVEVDSTARRQLRRLHSLVEQLAEVEPAASLPLIVAAMAEALGVEQLCVHLLVGSEEAGGAVTAEDRVGEAEPRLRLSAAVGLLPPLLDALAELPVGPSGGPPGIAASAGEVVVVEDVRRDERWLRFRFADRFYRPRSSWSVPIMGSSGLLGTISGFARTAGRPQADHLELVSLYAGYAAASIERERLLADATRRNRVLETLRGVLNTLAGPQPAQGALAVALLALCRGLAADAISVYHVDGDRSEYWATDLAPAASAIASARQRAAAEVVHGTGARLDRARPVGPDVLAVPIVAPGGCVVVTAWWMDTGRLNNDALDLLDDAARSLRLALEREAFEQANAEAASLRHSQHMQREFLSLLNHELRTPLTAIQGYASTLRQTDVSWDEWSQQRFLDSIASESERMGRLVGDLLDFSAIDSGTLRLQPDWCDLGLVLEAARRCVTDAPPSFVALSDCTAIPAIWADHDRLEQVFVNLLENAVRHADGASTVEVSATLEPDGQAVTVCVHDDGRGIPLALADRVFLPRERGRTDGPGAGLGLAIARGIVEAHGGTITLESGAGGTSVLVALRIEPASDDVVAGGVEAQRW
jgi:signal transduction histidine kinase/ABC-type branched-subunit amino acid transport system ATPase component